MGETILYADDDRSNRTVFQATLTPAFRVVCVESGEEALGAMGREEIAVLVSDQRMPGMTGVELLETTAREYPDVVRILLTGYSDLDAATDAINRGQVARYVRKPWRPEELRAVIRDAVDVFQTRARLRALERRLRETERVYAVGVVAASVAHDLRNPLMVARLSLERAQEGLRAPGGAREPKVLTSVEKAGQAVEHIAEIVAGIDLSYRRTRARTTADLVEVTRLTISLLEGAFRNRGELDVELAPVPSVVGSPTALSQVVLNLLVNALEALPEGGGPGAKVTLRLRRDGANALVEVADRGAGMPPEILGRIFDPFFSTKEDGGTGLGLAISKRIVDDLGGSLEARSTVGEGSCFTVRVPLAEGA
jgi:signal transduction histidine kinase